MKSFSKLREDIDSMKATMKGFADTMVPQMKKYANSQEVKDMKKDVANLFLTKGQDLLNQGQKNLNVLKKQVGKVETPYT